MWRSDSLPDSIKNYNFLNIHSFITIHLTYHCFISFLQAVAYHKDEFMRRKFRVMNLLAEMFDSTDWHILHSPFIYSAGITKSIVVCDVSTI